MRASVVVAAAALALTAGCAPSGPAPGQRSPAVADAAGQRAPLPVLVAKASPTVVYVLARTQTGTSELFRSSDAGLHFSQVSAPVLRSPATGRPLPVRILTFANGTDGIAVLGSPDQHGAMLVTDNAARSWRRARLGGRGAVTAVAGHGGLAYALELDCGGTVCHDLRLYRAAAGSARFARTTARGTVGAQGAGGIGLAAWGPRVWLMTGNGTGAPIQLLESADRGATFSQVAQLTAVGCGPEAGTATVLWLWCSGGMLLTFDRFSASTNRLQQLRLTGSGTGNTFLFPLSGRQVLFGTGDGRQAGGIYLSRDCGRNFTRIGSLPGPASGLFAQLTFLTARNALALVSQRRLLRTSTGGRTWTQVRL
jgi:photosystem II stability/assembly factor-like uncharacterized protein